MERIIDYIGDCPNSGDFEKVVINLDRAIKTQEEFYKWKEEQPLQPIKYSERSLN